MAPETHYARSGHLSIAYQVVGGGPMDLVVVPGWISNIEVFWEDPHVARFFKTLAWLVHEHDIEPHIPVWEKSMRTDGVFSSRGDFTYDTRADVYRCPGGKVLT